MTQYEFIETGDGSKTLFIPELNETYHSKHGALREAEHVFIEKGLNYILNRSINELAILEVGFGTGLNALLTFLHVQNSPVKLYYDGVERFPLSEEMMHRMEYGKIVADSQADALFSKIITCKWNMPVLINNSQTLRKLEADIHNHQFDGSYDLVYFDAFCFRAQEDMWSKDVFQKLYEACNKNAVFVTYASKGIVRRTLKEIGFQVEKLPGPTGKREMLRAIKI